MSLGPTTADRTAYPQLISAETCKNRILFCVSLVSEVDESEPRVTL